MENRVLIRSSPNSLLFDILTTSEQIRTGPADPADPGSQISDPVDPGSPILSILSILDAGPADPDSTLSILDLGSPILSDPFQI